jgi:hypothetical protein
MKKLKTLQDVYDAIPDVHCKGHCHESCALIPLFAVETEAMEKQGAKIG